jgi:3-oxoacyl-(acyl-carrier-protein) synthase/malonyl CoA-acyl carrier protein transacylase
MEFRNATIADITDLLEIEAQCWAPHLRANKESILQRIALYPDGQYVVDVNGKARGVLYTQRIIHPAALVEGKYETQFDLHDAKGNTVQLLAIAVDKSEKRAGVFLRDSALASLTADPTVQQVVAMSRCSGFAPNAGSSDHFDDYVKHVMSLKDPTLHFHVSGGAEIVQIVRDYRPEDADNLRCAVMIRYPLAGRSAHDLPEKIKTLAADICQQLVEWGSADTSDLRALLDAPLMNSIDSLGMLTLVNWIEERLKVTLPTGFLFKAPTPLAIQEWFERQHQPVPEMATALPVAAADTEHEPLAIVGVACKLPGGIDSPEKLWDVMMNKTCLSEKVPFSRWDVDSVDLQGLINDAAKEQCVQHGCFVKDVDAFDPAFFGINKDEVRNMDPNQRILLETVTRALYDSGKTKEELSGSNTGVWVGMSNSDYQDVPGAGFKESKSVYGATGGAASVAAGRVSYLLGLNGPSLVVDTACSSSLVAMNQASVALQRGQCEEAVVAGINLMLAPWISVAYARAGMTSPDGKCHTFDEAANGYCRGEGCGAVVLKRLSKALEDGDGIYAILRGSAVLQDGKSASLTAPNGLAQEQLLRAALKDAKVDPREVSYVEAHGTGTKLGDPIEVDALATVYGRDRPAAAPLLVSSVKANVGHLEAAAGMAGLFSVIMALNHGFAPPNGQLQTVNSMVAAAVGDAAIQFPTQSSALCRTQQDRMLIAGLSSFGYSGTIAHVVVEEPPFNQRRPVVPHPACFVNPDANMWQFTGQGGLAIDAGRELYERSAVYRAALERCDAVIVDLLGVSASQLLYPDDDFLEQAEEMLSTTVFAQPLLVVLQYCTAKEWASKGLVPSVVLGHSLGEYTASVIAGVMTIEDCLRIVCARAQIFQETVPTGVMCALRCTAEDAGRAIFTARTASQVSIAAINGPTSIVLSGPAIAVDRTVAAIRGGPRPQYLDVPYAFHSPLMANAMQRFAAVLNSVQLKYPNVTLVRLLLSPAFTSKNQTNLHFILHRFPPFAATNRSAQKSRPRSTGSTT